MSDGHVLDCEVRFVLIIMRRAAEVDERVAGLVKAVLSYTSDGEAVCAQAYQWRQRLREPEAAEGGLVTDCGVEGNVARFLLREEDASLASLAIVKVSTGENRDNRKIRLIAFARRDIDEGQWLTAALG